MTYQGTPPFVPHISNKVPSSMGVVGTLGTADTRGTSNVLPVSVNPLTGGQYTHNLGGGSASIDSDPLIADAINRIFEEYGVNVSVTQKAKSLNKFGVNTAVGTALTGYTIWVTGQDEANETYAAANTNPIDTVSGGGTDVQPFVLEGHTESGGNKTFVSQNGTLNGTAKVTLSTALNRATRFFNDGTTDLTSEVYVYEGRSGTTALTSGKPNDTSLIHLTVRMNRNQSEKASTSLSSTDYWIITTMRASVVEKVSAVADVALQIRLNGKVFREIEDVTTSNGVPGFIKFNPYIVAPANSDVRLVGIASASNTEVSGSIFGYLAKVV